MWRAGLWVDGCGYRPSAGHCSQGVNGTLPGVTVPTLNFDRNARSAPYGVGAYGYVA